MQLMLSALKSENYRATGFVPRCSCTTKKPKSKQQSTMIIQSLITVAAAECAATTAHQTVLLY